MYQATVTTRLEKETYVGLTATEFKTRWRNHQISFKHEKKGYDIELSKYLWELKKKNEQFAVSWKILAKAIITNPQMATLNKHNELVSTCRHRRNYILKYNRLVIERLIISARMHFLYFFEFSNALLSR